ncbi:quinone oxidoreductase family protein [Hymenobacter pini]|uniref:quinone oxidoreductase family protein n=1 Tax=Hymenobacter pini TaxID=2880879 RepID=UPI001CF12389|nr:quinone oxidoreductase [Hymenobacter pini]MCA8829476.1 quinone oxidoreductase [Hymenobacter pini]
MHALTFSSFGGPDVLKYQQLPTPELLPGTVLLRTRAIGLNYADVYRRQGNYHLAGAPPYIAGYEAAGVVEAVGPGVTDVQVGQRMAFADVPHANAELVRIPADHLLPLPDDVSFEAAAALLLQGLTAQYLTHDSYAVRPGTVALVHAVAGGVGQLLTQYIKVLGGRVIGLTSSEAKRQQALAAGADTVLLYADDWVATVQATGGAHVVYDSVGSTLAQSFEAVRATGTVVFFGMAGGDPAPVDPRMLMDASKTLTGGDLWSYLTSREERVRRASALFELVRQGKLTANITATFPLAEGAAAHRLLESRQSTGKVLLLP